MSALDELDKLHDQKQNLILGVTATINIAQQSIAKSLKFKRELTELLNKYNLCITETEKKPRTEIR